jgi:hypothetical protein
MDLATEFERVGIMGIDKFISDLNFYEGAMTELEVLQFYSGEELKLKEAKFYKHLFTKDKFEGVTLKQFLTD